jgi:hypothetical protein
MYTITTEQEVKMFWFKLCEKDLFRFKNADSLRYNDMCNLSGAFINEGDSAKINNIEYYCINVVNLKGKTFKFYLNNKCDVKNWMRALTYNTNNSNILEDYELGVRVINLGYC